MGSSSGSSRRIGWRFLNLSARPRLGLAAAMGAVAFAGISFGLVRWSLILRHRAQDAAVRSAIHAGHLRAWTELARVADGDGARDGGRALRWTPVTAASRWGRDPIDAAERARFDGLDPGADRLYIVSITRPEFLALDGPERLPPARQRALCREKVTHHRRLMERWSRVARSPWIGAEPDPPGPPLIAEMAEFGDGPF